MKGIAQIADEVLTMAETTSDPQEKTLADSVVDSLKTYFDTLEGQTPSNVYDMVLAQVEEPLLKLVLKLTNQNQSKAAIILGISRGTLRKKMAIYKLNES